MKKIVRILAIAGGVAAVSFSLVSAQPALAAKAAPKSSVRAKESFVGKLVGLVTGGVDNPTDKSRGGAKSQDGDGWTSPIPKP